MVSGLQRLLVDQTDVIRLENRALRVDVAPGIGGRIVHVQDKATGYQFLWRNGRLRLERSSPGSAYDPRFYGGIDELLPSDEPELFNGTMNPDHGELWTLPLASHVEGESLVLEEVLPLCGLAYEKRVWLEAGNPVILLDYRLENRTGERRVFRWQMHAALHVQPGDQIVCPARFASVADPQWSRWGDIAPFAWPMVEGERADLIPPANGTTDYLFLHDLQDGMMGWRSPSRGLEFSYRFDRGVFPYACYFASYGGLDGHYTAILEPSTAMPVSVNEAARLGQCSSLAPGEQIVTRVTIYAGPVQTA